MVEASNIAELAILSLSLSPRVGLVLSVPSAVSVPTLWTPRSRRSLIASDQVLPSRFYAGIPPTLSMYLGPRGPQPLPKFENEVIPAYLR